MNPDNCTLHQNCECPLCPLEEDSNQVWYSEDEICKNPDFHIIGNSMKKLKKKAAQGYFTLQMLNRDFIVRKGTEGADPDIPDSIKDPWGEDQEREKTWLRRHPEISKARPSRTPSMYISLSSNDSCFILSLTNFVLVQES